MNWPDTQVWLANFSLRMAGFAIHWLLQSSVLLVIGLTIGRLLQERGAAVQSAVYRTTLAAVLCCPLASWALSQAGLSGWSIELSTFATQASRSSPADGAESLTIAVGTSQFEDVDRATAVSAKYTLKSKGKRLAEPPGLQRPTVSEAEGKQAKQVLGAAPQKLRQAAEPSLQSHSASLFERAVVSAIVSWLLVTLVLCWRLVIAWRALARLRQGATQADENTLRNCQALASTLHVPTPEVLHSPWLPSPCLAGLRSPAVLLPETDEDLPIRDVLIHELAHLRRYDCHWNLLRQIATALFFFQPLLWVLSRRLEASAEEVCDDYVVLFGENRQRYAHRLVDIAELCTAPTRRRTSYCRTSA